LKVAQIDVRDFVFFVRSLDLVKALIRLLDRRLGDAAAIVELGVVMLLDRNGRNLRIIRAARGPSAASPHERTHAGDDAQEKDGSGNQDQVEEREARVSGA
jgi:hypothetical protein